MRLSAKLPTVLWNDPQYWQLFKQKFNLGAWPLDDASGIPVRDLSVNTHTGTSVGTYTRNQAGILAAHPSTAFNVGAVNLYSTSLRDKFNPLAGTLMIWAKVSDAGVWADGIARTFAHFWATGGSVKISKADAGGGNNLRFGYITKVLATLRMPTDFFQAVITWDAVADEVKAYLNGTFSSEQNAIGVWSGTLNANITCLGATRQDSLIDPWLGNIAFAGLASRVLTAQEIQDLHDQIFPTRGLLTLGDSKTNADAWTRLLADGLQSNTEVRWEERPASISLGGWVLADGLAAMNAVLPGEWQKSHIAWINFGANDVSALPAEATWKANLVSMIDGLRAKWNLPVYITRPWRRGFAAECNTLAGWIAAVAGTYADRVFLGDDERIWLEGGDDGATMTTDGIHYSTTGQIVAANAKLIVIYEPMAKTIFDANLVSLYTLDELTGTLVLDQSGNALNGVSASCILDQPGFGDGKTSYAFDGINSRVNIHSVGFNAKVNKAEGSVAVWLKVSAVADWTDGANRYAVTLFADNDNHIMLLKTDGANTFNLVYKSGGVAKSRNLTISPTDWFHVAITWSKAADEVKFYLNGSQQDITLTTLSDWVGDFNPAFCAIGSLVGTAANSPWKGNADIVTITDRPMTVLEVVQLASPVSYNGILFLGDSKSQAGIAGAAWITTLIDSIRTITANWVELPRRVATSGWLVADLATGFAAAKASMPASPAVVVINVGANDTDTVGDGVAWKASYLTLVNDVHTTFPSTTIYLTKIWKRNTAAAKVIMDAKIDELLASYSWLTAGIDEGTILPGADDGATMTSDGLHYSIAGCTAVATAWKTMMGY